VAMLLGPPRSGDAPDFLDAVVCLFCSARAPRHPHSFPTRRSSDLQAASARGYLWIPLNAPGPAHRGRLGLYIEETIENELEERRSEEHTSELQSRENLVCRLLLETKESSPTGTARAAPSSTSRQSR